jgi:hypothetical protein
MSNKVKKQASSMSFSLSKWFSKVSTMRPSNLLMTTVVMAVALSLLCGGVYWINNATNSALTFRFPISVYDGRSFHLIYDRTLASSNPLGDQFGAETVLVFIVYALGLIGLLTMYRSARNAYDHRQAYMMLITGASILFIAYLLVEYFVSLKIG